MSNRSYSLLTRAFVLSKMIARGGARMRLWTLVIVIALTSHVARAQNEGYTANATRFDNQRAIGATASW